MKYILTLLALFATSFSFADHHAEENKPAASSTLPISLMGSINFKKDSLKDDMHGTSDGFNFYAQIDAVYYFSNNVGLFTAIGYNPFKLDFVGNNGKAAFLDIPIGFSFTNNALNFNNRGSNITNVGFFFGLPISDYEVAGTSYDTDMAMGFSMSSYQFFPVNSNFSLGMHGYMKYQFNDVVDFGSSNEAGSYFSFGFGLAAKFF